MPETSRPRCGLWSDEFSSHWRDLLASQLQGRWCGCCHRRKLANAFEIEGEENDHYDGDFLEITVEVGPAELQREQSSETRSTGSEEA